ncbi:PilZ domain-containing protein [Syntrophus buswellii]|uniref:PilZ domain-containing protein n=1 Tax=Syntrophus buswellii TaxID=43774 RepID=UPI0038D365C4
MRAGSQLDVVLESDIYKEQVVARKAMVYDVQDQRIIISQTSPPLYRRHIGVRVNASYLLKVGAPESRPAIRMGIPATIVEYQEAYPLSSSNVVPAFVLKQTGEPAEINLRTHYRVRPPSSSDLLLLVNGERVNLINLSLGGIQYSHRRGNPPTEYGNVTLTLQSGGRVFKTDGKVVRISSPVAAAVHAQEMEYVTVRFLGNNRDLEFFLGKKILMIERQLISEGKIVD